jgi:DNA-binding winged helix-turn-helix (wHTH) protein
MKHIYEFEDFRADPAEQLLLHEGQPVALTPKVFETLLILLESEGRLIDKEDFITRLWPGVFVEDVALAKNISHLRRILAEGKTGTEMIQTVPKRGYRFVVPVRKVLDQTAEPSPAGDLPAAPAEPGKGPPWSRWAIALVLLAASSVGAFLFLRHKHPVLTEKDTVVLADFSNSTGDPVFDGTLRQGLAVELEQSPFLNLISDQQIQQALSLMGQPADARLTPTIAREICERTASAAVLEGSIANLGREYVLGLQAMDCHSGAVLAEEQGHAATKEGVLNTLGQIASRFRSRVGETLATVEEHNTPLAEATTPSLEALKAYSTGWKVDNSAGEAAALPFFQRAVEIDPQFAMAYASLGLMYSNNAESALAAENVSKAYALRDRVSDKERYFIDAYYDGRVTGNMEKAQQTCEAWARTYPREMAPHTFLGGFIYQASGKYEKAAEEAGKGREIEPDAAIVYLELVLNYAALGQLDKSQRAVRAASDRDLDNANLLITRYDLAFLQADKAEMDRIVALAQGRSGAEDGIADHQAFVLAYSGHLREARKMAEHAVALAQQAAHPERAAIFETGAALWEAFFGNQAAAKRRATTALALTKDREVEYGAAFALALSGESSQAQAMAHDLENHFPDDTAVRFSYLPSLRALIALNHGESSQAIELLQAAAPYELGEPRSHIQGFFGSLYPVYVRGEAFLAARRGADAAAEFQKILHHGGITFSDPIGALARLQLARAYALSGDRTKATASYRDFLALWKDADPDIPIFQQAKVEYAKLQ